MRSWPRHEKSWGMRWLVKITPVKRHLFNATAAVSLFLCLTTQGFAIFAKRHPRCSIVLVWTDAPTEVHSVMSIGGWDATGFVDRTRTNDFIMPAKSDPSQQNQLEQIRRRFRELGPPGRKIKFSASAEPDPGKFGRTNNGGDGSSNFPMGYGNLSELFLVLPAFWILVAVERHIRNRGRVAPGCCRTCGYDLRASPDRCPECGSEVLDHPRQI
jgi:hypothetical protein